MQPVLYPFFTSRFVLTLAATLSVSACSTLKTPLTLPAEHWAPNKNSEHSKTLEQVLAAEFTLHRQGSSEAIPLFMEAAAQNNNLDLIKRATATALMSENNQAILDATERWVATSPTDAEVYPIRLQALLNDGQIEPAKDLLRGLKNLNVPFDFLPTFVDQNVRDEQVIQNLDKTLSSPDLKDELYIRIAQYHLDFINGRYPYIVETITPLIKVAPESELEGLIIIRAFSEDQLGFKNKAQHTLEKGLQQFPESQRLLANLLEILVKNGKVTTALELFDSAHFPSALQQQIGLAMGQLLLQQGHTVESMLLLSSLPLKGTLKDQILYVLANAQHQAGHYDEALKNLANVYGQLSWKATERLVSWLYESKQPEQINAIILKRAINDQEPGHIIGVSDLHVKNGHPDLALTLLSESIKYFPEVDALLYKRALTYDMQEKWEEAIADLKILHKRHPDDAAYMNALGYTIMVRNPDEFNQAFDLVKKAYTLDPEDPAIIDSMGWGYFIEGDLERAADYLAQAWNQLQDAEIGAHYGEVLWHLGEERQALKIWRRALMENKQLPSLIHTIEQYAPNILNEA